MERVLVGAHNVDMAVPSGPGKGEIPPQSCDRRCYSTGFGKDDLARLTIWGGPQNSDTSIGVPPGHLDAVFRCSPCGRPREGRAATEGEVTGQWERRLGAPAALPGVRVRRPGTVALIDERDRFGEVMAVGARPDADSTAPSRAERGTCGPAETLEPGRSTRCHPE